MKKTTLIAALSLFNLSVMAQDAKPEESFVFTTMKENLVTSIKNQNRSNTCWSFSALGFIESELLRLGRGEYNLSEMFAVHKTMQDHGVNYVRYHGDNSFSPGGSFCDVMHCIKNYGIVPQEVMPGIMYGDTLPVHSELDAVASGYINTIAKGRLSKLTPVWKNGLSAIYDTYLGACPEKLTYKDKKYTPKTFAESLGLNCNDYVSLTLYTHHSFYSQSAIEIQGSQHNGLSYNLPIEEPMAVMDSAVKKGYTFAWGSDVSKQGFSRDGIAVMLDVAKESELSGSDMARWTGLTAADKHRELFTKPFPEKDIIQEMHQATFDNWETTDDHGVVIYDVTKDQNGGEYFMVKNSQGKSDKYDGTWYASKAFVAYKTMNILMRKDVLPKKIAEKLRIE